MDIFIDRKKRVWIVDFNPFGDPSAALLFEWKELDDLCFTISPSSLTSKSEKDSGIEVKNTESIDNSILNGTENIIISTSSSKNDKNKNDQDDNENDNNKNKNVLDNDADCEIDFEFRIINNKNETFSSAAGSSRGPIDVTLAPDFHKFMEICKNQQKEDMEENSDD